MRAIEIGSSALFAKVANVRRCARVGCRETTAGRSADRIDRLIVDRFAEGVRHTQTETGIEPAPQRELRGVIVRIAAVVEIGDRRELLVRSELQSERVVFNAARKTAGAVDVQLADCGSRVEKTRGRGGAQSTLRLQLRKQWRSYTANTARATAA